MARRRARTNLIDFALYTKPDYAPSWHHRRLCAKLDQFAAGKIKRLMVLMPPQHGKSELVSRRLPAYLLGRNPNVQIIAASYNGTLAARMSRDTQRVIDSDAYRRLFPDTQLAGPVTRATVGTRPAKTSTLFEIVGADGNHRAAGVRGGITGQSMDIGIIDDPFKDREQADSPVIRERVWEWYTSTFYSRARGTAGLLLTMTPWNQDDLRGRLLALAKEDPTADQWEVVSFPAIKVDDANPDDPRQIGDALWQDRFPLSVLAKIKANSAYEWSALYMLDPRGQGTLEWPDDYFGPGIWFDEWPTDLLYLVLALDPSKGKSSKAGDYSAYVLAGIDAGGTLWIDADLARRPTSRMVQDGLEHFRKRRPHALAVEINQYQELLGPEFLRQAELLNMHLPIYGMNNTVPKEVRIRRLGTYLAQGKMRFKAKSKGAKLLVQQMREFPCGMFDDGPDACEMAVRMIAALQGEADERDQPQIVRA